MELNPAANNGSRCLPFPVLTITAAIDILAVAVIIYQLLQIVRETRAAAHILAGILTVFVAYQIALRTVLEALRTLLASARPVHGRLRSSCCFNRRSAGRSRGSGANASLAAMRGRNRQMKSCWLWSALSRDRVGGLIVIESDIGLRTFIESGVRLDSQISRDLLLSIFLPGHRVARWRGDCAERPDRGSGLLPSAERESSPWRALWARGTAAGIGITEETDCLALIVSEETGKISVASFGEMESDVTVERVDERISLYFGVASEKKPALLRATAPLSKHSAHQCMLNRSRRKSGRATDALPDLKSDLGSFFALVAAFGVWLNVASEPNWRTTVSVPVEYNNFPKDLRDQLEHRGQDRCGGAGPAGQLRSLN